MRRAGIRRQPLSLTPRSPTPLLRLSHLIRPAALMSAAASCPGPSPRLCFAPVQRRAGWGPGPCAAAAAPPPLPALPGPAPRARPAAPPLPGSPTALAQPVTSTCPPGLPSHPAPGPRHLPALNPASDQVPRWGTRPSRRVLCPRSGAAGTARRGQPRRGVDTPWPSRARTPHRRARPGTRGARLEPTEGRGSGALAAFGLGGTRDRREPRPAPAVRGPAGWGHRAGGRPREGAGPEPSYPL